MKICDAVMIHQHFTGAGESTLIIFTDKEIEYSPETHVLTDCDGYFYWSSYWCSYAKTAIINYGFHSYCYNARIVTHPGNDGMGYMIDCDDIIPVIIITRCDPQDPDALPVYPKRVYTNHMYFKSHHAYISTKFAEKIMAHFEIPFEIVKISHPIRNVVYNHYKQKRELVGETFVCDGDDECSSAWTCTSQTIDHKGVETFNLVRDGKTATYNFQTLPKSYDGMRDDDLDAFEEFIEKVFISMANTGATNMMEI